MNDYSVCARFKPQTFLFNFWLADGLVCWCSDNNKIMDSLVIRFLFGLAKNLQNSISLHDSTTERDGFVPPLVTVVVKIMSNRLLKRDSNPNNLTLLFHRQFEVVGEPSRSWIWIWKFYNVPTGVWKFEFHLIACPLTVKVSQKFRFQFGFRTCLSYIYPTVHNTIIDNHYNDVTK